MKVEATEYGDRRVYTVTAFNRGVGSWLQRLPTVWVEGEISELRRQERWQSVFFTLKDTGDGSILTGSMPRGQFDALRLDLRNGERVHVYGRPELFEQRGELRLRALGIERFGLGQHLAALERLKQKLAAEGLFSPERKRQLPRFPRRIGLVTGNDAAAKRDVLTAVQSRFPAARLLVAETFVQGPRAAAAVGVDALTSAARSQSGVSCSCPTALTIGTGQPATARTTRSSLNGSRSSKLPPPRARTTTSTSGSAVIAPSA